ncbi:MAG: hypothetical protein C0467_23395 [Planctomycetaceae bacterium]|nr:hypothetical protein [Planctomycetaceae bacterium]
MRYPRPVVGRCGSSGAAVKWVDGGPVRRNVCSWPGEPDRDADASADQRIGDLQQPINGRGGD